MIKKSLYLKAQYKQVKADIAALRKIDTRSTRNRPTATHEVGELGSREAPWIVLATGQSSSEEKLVHLEGVMPIDFSLHYVSQSHKKGFFGVDRASSYEKQFVFMSEGRYALVLPCGSLYLFTIQEDGSFKDEGDLGVTVERIDSDRYALHYHEGNIEYYSHGYLVGIKDSNSNILTLEYGQGSKLKRMSNAFGAYLELEYNKQGLVASMSDQSGRVWSFGYDEMGMLVSIALNGTPLVSYAYVSAIVESKEVKLLSHVYTPQKKEKLTLSYDATLKLSSYSYAGVRYSYTYEDPSTIIQTSATQSAYCYGLDTMGRIASIAYPDGSYEAESYDEATHTSTLQTRGGNTRVEVYDDRARLLSLAINGSVERSYSYEGKNPHPIGFTQEGQHYSYMYDEHYNLITLTNPDETTQHYTYTLEGQRLTHTDALGQITLYHYNDKVQLLSIEEPNGSSQHFSYDALGRIENQTDAQGQKHCYSYNLQDQVTQYHDPEGKEIRFAYTAEGELQSLTDPAKRVTTYSYDSHSRLIEKCYPNHSKETYSYNIEGELSSIERVDGSILYFSYDANDNITQITAKDTEGNEQIQSYSYDALSNLLSAKSANHTLSLKYNEKASITVEVQDEIKLHKTYLENQKQLQSLGIFNEWIHYGYDASQNISHIRYQAKEIELNYDANKVPTQRKYPNKHKEKMVYDKGYNLTTLQSYDTLEYSYDDTGRVVKKHNRSKDKETDYTYSPSGMLLQAGEQHYSSNNTGNLTHHDQDYNSLNQLLEDRDYLYAYDKRGNLKEKLHKQTKHRSTYVFNLFDQLEKVKTVDTNKNLIEGFKYTYDALNRRVSKTTYTQETLPHGTTHHYVYDEENIVAILDSNKALLATIIHDTKTDTPLSITTMNNSPRELNPAEKSSYSTLSEEEQTFLNKRRTQRTYYYHRDHQGSITALTNEEGKIVESFLYDEAYGIILDHHKTEETYNPYCYTGREFDSHDLYYYRARYYDPNIGRFISSDPIEFLAGDVNFYRYVGGDPVNFVDPTGLKSAHSKISVINPNKKYKNPLTGKRVRGKKFLKNSKKYASKVKAAEASRNHRGGFSVKGNCEPCHIDEKAFLKEYKKQFKTKLNTKQTQTLKTILKCMKDYYKKKGKSCDLNQMAYVLATAKHETQNFTSLYEKGNGKRKDGIDHYFDRYDPVLGSKSQRNRARKRGNTKKGDGYKYRGRGLVHLTWKDNYRKAGKVLGLDLINNPKLAAKPCNATKIALWGMEGGKFTGVGLSKYINKKHIHYESARRIINGIDQKAKIARYARKLRKTLKKVNPC